MENRRERFSNGIIGGGIAAAVIIAVLLVSQTGISQDAAPLPLIMICKSNYEPENEVASQTEDKLLVYTTFYPLYQFTQGLQEMQLMYEF
ncbi:MAG: hypothetical protein CM1200mP11_4350 [Nitrosopumilaceae archaeon]|nr:MAG: hypothetical protein CM1200mP11_4350 [Nitrosopumilaceae archaeon]